MTPDGSPLDALAARLASLRPTDDEAAADRQLLDVFNGLAVAGRDGRGALRERVRQLPASAGVPEVAHTSRVPGGTLAHRAVDKATRRQRDALAQSLGALAHEVQGALLDTVACLDDADDHRARRDADIDATIGRVAQLESRLSGIARQMATIEARLADLEARSPTEDREPTEDR